MRALRPVDAAKYFSNFTLLPSGKMQALWPIDTTKYFSDVHNYYIVVFLMCVWRISIKQLFFVMHMAHINFMSSMIFVY